MTTDWRLYEMLTKENWRPGDEPTIKKKIVVQYKDKLIEIPVPAHAIVEVEEQ